MKSKLELPDEDFEMPNNPEASTMHLVSITVSLFVGLILGIALTMAVIKVVNFECIAGPYCNEHENRR